MPSPPETPSRDAMLIVPLAATPSQTVSVTLAGQAFRIAVYQKSSGLFGDLSINDVPATGGVI